MNNRKKIKTQIRKGILDFLIMSAIKKEARYPREIIDILSEQNFDLVEGTLYPLFLRLIKQDYVHYEWREAGGHPRKYYSLTKSGREVLDTYESEWQALNDIIKKLTN